MVQCYECAPLHWLFYVHIGLACFKGKIFIHIMQEMQADDTCTKTSLSSEAYTYE